MSRTLLIASLAGAAGFKVAPAPLMKLRGGASIGPVDADLAIKIKCAITRSQTHLRERTSPTCPSG